MLEGKIWGTTRTLIRTSTIELHYVEIIPRAFSSMHMHRYRFNAFYVIEGTLTIETEKNDYPLVDKTVLGPGDFTSVRPNEYHRFISGDQPVIALEIYYPESMSIHDIVRKNHGGIIPDINDYV